MSIAWQKVFFVLSTMFWAFVPMPVAQKHVVATFSMEQLIAVEGIIASTCKPEVGEEYYVLTMKGEYTCHKEFLIGKDLITGNHIYSDGTVEIIILAVPVLEEEPTHLGGLRTFNSELI